MRITCSQRHATFFSLLLKSLPNLDFLNDFKRNKFKIMAFDRDTHKKFLFIRGKSFSETKDAEIICTKEEWSILNSLLISKYNTSDSYDFPNFSSKVFDCTTQKQLINILGIFCTEEEENASNTYDPK